MMENINKYLFTVPCASYNNQYNEKLYRRSNKKASPFMKKNTSLNKIKHL